MAVVVGGLGAAGVPGVIEAWDRLRPMHAWLGLFGAISLTIFATLVYLVPTVVGARIRAGWSLRPCLHRDRARPRRLTEPDGRFRRRDPRGRRGGHGADGPRRAGQLGYIIDCVRRRGTFTGELDWRRVAVVTRCQARCGSRLRASPRSSASSVAARSPGGRLACSSCPWWRAGCSKSSSDRGPISFRRSTPGDPARHARQRSQSAFAGRARLVAWNAGLALLWLGAATHATWMAVRRRGAACTGRHRLGGRPGTAPSSPRAPSSQASLAMRPTSAIASVIDIPIGSRRARPPSRASGRDRASGLPRCQPTPASRPGSGRRRPWSAPSTPPRCTCTTARAQPQRSVGRNWCPRSRVEASERLGLRDARHGDRCAASRRSMPRSVWRSHTSSKALPSTSPRRVATSAAGQLYDWRSCTHSK